jgi:4a-hydroxytetrahydrobiopterin dehydratase
VEREGDRPGSFVTDAASRMDKPKILTRNELLVIMPRLAGWKLAQNKLSRTFAFQDFVQSLSFVNSLVAYFETIDHHPDVYIAYGEVTFELTAMTSEAR